MLNVLILEGLDINDIETELQAKHDEAPQFFMNSPLIVDCSAVAKQLIDDLSFDFTLLKDTLLKTGFIPVGLRNAPASLSAKVTQSGWAVMRATPKPLDVSSRTQKNDESSVTTENESADSETKQAEPVSDASAGNFQQAETQEQIQPQAVNRSKTIERPVRSGQQIYAADADMTVLAATSAGSEIVADGSIHVYGALRGRALAGARGNESARIFCQSLQAELIAIAGRYQLLDESDTALKGKPAMIRLDGEKLIIEPLV